MEKIISVILPTYNGEKYLKQSIESILKQTYKNFELIIVNDCSTDLTFNIAKEYESKDSRVKVISNKENKKLPMSLNIGFEAAKGDYFTWTSDDNYYEPDALEEMLNFLKKNPAIDLVYTNYQRIDENGNFLDEVKANYDVCDFIKHCTIGACFLYKKQIAKQVGEYDKSKFLVEDYDFWLRLGLVGKISSSNKNLYNYRVHSSSLTATRVIDISNKTQNLFLEYMPQYIVKYPELKQDKNLINNYYKILKNLYLKTGYRRYISQIEELGSKYKLKALPLRDKFEKIHSRIKKQKLYQQKIFTPERFDRALDWINKYTVKDSGIALESNLPDTIYPEVTGYYIPTLIRWGEKDRAKKFADYLLSIQNPDGSWNDPAGACPYTFDTGQILKGLWEFIDKDEKYKTAFLRGCDWILTQQREDGSISTPDYTYWKLPNGRVIPEAIHLYCLEPLRNASKKFGIEKYKTFVDKALKFYLAQDDLIEFNTLSHFHAYIIEALIDNGKTIKARAALDRVIKFQKKNGFIPAYPDNKNSTCSTGSFQYAICWYKLGELELANKTFAKALSLQNKSGGFFGSYGEGSNYFQDREISWAVKYFLDAIYFGQKCAYDKIYNDFFDRIDSNDGRLLAVDNEIKKTAPSKILDLGCGKGRYSRELIKKYPDSKFFGVDISNEILAFTPDELEIRQGLLLEIPFDDETFDFIFCVEALEHAINIKGAIKEITRVLKPGGKILIIDKDIKALGRLELAPWEQWFDKEELKLIMKQNGLCVNIIENIPYEIDNKQDGLFVSWIGEKQMELNK